jgi:outer membrane protein assembly factor BamA
MSRARAFPHGALLTLAACLVCSTPLSAVARPPRSGAALPLVGRWPGFGPRQRTPAGAQGVSQLPRQAAAPPLPPLKAVTVTGSVACSPGRLVAVTGLRMGQAVSRAVFQQALQRLADTGDFGKLTYRYTYSPAGTDVQFQVTDSAHLLPLVFNNFVWLPSGQLVDLLRGEVPAFCGEVPMTGGVDKQITGDLQAYLQGHGVKGATIDGMPYQTHLGSSSFDSYLFSVEGVKIPMQAIAFPGAPAGLAPVLRRDAATLMAHSYARDRVAAAIQATFLPELRNRGFLQAKFAAPVVRLTNPATHAVRVSLAVNPGPPYRWGAIRIQGNVAIPGGVLQKLITMRTGSIADRATLDQDITAIQKLYGNSGYIQAQAVPGFDYSASGVAAVTIAIHEGAQFLMGAVNFQGVAGNAAAQLSRLWGLHSGQPYRAGYLGEYLKSIYAHFNFRGVNISTTVAPNPKTHLVNITLTLSSNGTA